MSTTTKRVMRASAATVKPLAKDTAPKKSAVPAAPQAPGTERALQLAKEKAGKLTYDDLNQILPEDATTEQIDEVMVALSDVDVEIVDDLRLDAETQKEQEKKQKQARRDEIRKDTSHSRYERADDPVRMYLREMGRVPLLTKDQEVSIAKRIEEAEEELTEVLLSTPYTIKEIQMLAARIMAGRLNFAQITDSEDIREQNRFVKKLPDLMDQLTVLSEESEGQEKKIHRTKVSDKVLAIVTAKIGEIRKKQAAIINEFNLKSKEMMKIARKIKGLDRKSVV